MVTSILKRYSVKLILVIIVALIIVGCAKDVNVKEGISSEKDIEDTQIFAGTIDVKGEGVRIILADNESSKNDINNIVHDVDLIKLVNILTREGAEVISINDERIISTSEIKANKMMIKINENEYTSPFIIKAIGNPDKLINGLQIKEKDYINTLKNYLVIKIEKKDNIFIPKYKGDIDFEYAKPIKE